MLKARAALSPFVVLWRAFFRQFFTSETAASDHQLRQAIVGVLAFLITPGFFLPLQLYGTFQFAAYRHPELLDGLIRLLATIFITYSFVSVGVLAAFAGDALTFDRRDAMVLGPLPVSGVSIVLAKLAALAAVLIGAAVTINLLTAVPFAMVASSHKAVGAFGQHIVGHVVATVSAATFVFSIFVTLRALAGMIGRGRVVLGSLLQFLLVSALLCFLVLVPTSLTIASRTGIVRMQQIPAWSPTNWFLGLYEVIRGSSRGEFDTAARRAAAFTLTVLAAAVLTTVASYRRQLQLALTPSASTGTLRAARLQRLLARAFATRDLVARAISDFIVTTIARSRAQQTPIAINAALGVVMIVLGLGYRGGGVASLIHSRSIVLSIPLMLAFWTLVGVRASFFVPSELPAAWTLRMHAPEHRRSYRAAARAAMFALVAPAALIVALAMTAALDGWADAFRHAVFVMLLIFALADVLVLTIDFIPFTRPYRPGHAKLKSRWPLYLFGAYGFSYGLVHIELMALGSNYAFGALLGATAVAIAVLELGGRKAAMKWSVDPDEGLADDSGGITVLDIGAVVRGAV